jgi:hypothetical protein
METRVKVTSAKKLGANRLLGFQGRIFHRKSVVVCEKPVAPKLQERSVTNRLGSRSRGGSRIMLQRQRSRSEASPPSRCATSRA